MADTLAATVAPTNISDTLGTVANTLAAATVLPTNISNALGTLANTLAAATVLPTNISNALGTVANTLAATNMTDALGTVASTLATTMAPTNNITDAMGNITDAIGNSTGFNLTEFCSSQGDDGGIAEGFCQLSDTVADFESRIAALEEQAEGMNEGLTNFYLIFAGSLVFLMQAGFAMLAAGSVRQKNVQNILLKNLLDACMGGIGFYTIGFGLAFGGDMDGGGKTFAGNAHFGLRNRDDYAFFFFQYAFAATAATIVAGTIAERCKMSAYVYYSFFLTSFVYPIIVHSIWDNNGFLSPAADDPFQKTGVVDFAGSGVVHMTGGTTALWAAIVLGPRRGRFKDENNKPLELPKVFRPHSVALQVLGTFILWFGWYGFNPGSVLVMNTADAAQTASLAAVTTTLAAASGAITAMFTDSFWEASRSGKVTYDLSMAMNGALTGLVAITSGCAVVPPFAAILIGMLAAWGYMWVAGQLVVYEVDDVVNAIPVHFFGGFFGLFATSLFAKQDLMEKAGFQGEHYGLFFHLGNFAMDFKLVVANLVGGIWIFGWCTMTMCPFFIILMKTKVFRVSKEEELLGMDLTHHKGPAYELGDAFGDGEEAEDEGSKAEGDEEAGEGKEQDSDDEEEKAEEVELMTADSKKESAVVTREIA